MSLLVILSLGFGYITAFFSNTVTYLATPQAYVRRKAISFVRLSSILIVKITDCLTHLAAPERLVNATKTVEIGENWLHYAPNHLARPSSVTNS